MNSNKERIAKYGSNRPGEACLGKKNKYASTPLEVTLWEFNIAIENGYL